jgi:hypothetical protein
MAEGKVAVPQAGSVPGEGLMAVRAGIYGLLAEFDDPTALVKAIQQARVQGYRQMDAYTPFPV